MNPDPAEFLDKLKQYPTPVLVDFWAPWCGPCKSIAHTLHLLEADYQGQVVVYRVNVDEKPLWARSLGVLAIPTLVVFRDGKEISRTIGAQSAENLRRLFEAAVRGEKPVLQLNSTDRLLRLGIGSVLVAVGLSVSGSWWVALLGGLVMFSGVYDRCPIWQALSPRLSSLMNAIKTRYLKSP